VRRLDPYKICLVDDPEDVPRSELKLAETRAVTGRALVVDHRLHTLHSDGRLLSGPRVFHHGGRGRIAANGEIVFQGGMYRAAWAQTGNVRGV
jgi:hypothetical protein